MSTNLEILMPITMLSSLVILQLFLKQWQTTLSGINPEIIQHLVLKLVRKYSEHI